MPDKLGIQDLESSSFKVIYNLM